MGLVLHTRVFLRGSPLPLIGVVSLGRPLKDAGLARNLLHSFCLLLFEVFDHRCCILAQVSLLLARLVSDGGVLGEEGCLVGSQTSAHTIRILAVEEVLSDFTLCGEYLMLAVSLR